jgi:2-polyprenyl-3-methyl-5-hydroxy-6-metoxy-1,4-benzoquinol methylase
LARFIGAFVLLTGYLPCCQLQPNQLAVFRIFAAQKLGFLPAYRLVNIQKTMENPHFSWENPIFHGKIHYKWPVSCGHEAPERGKALRGKRVLELGSGLGHLGHGLARLG